jgi:hypothetical protein
VMPFSDSVAGAFCPRVAPRMQAQVTSRAATNVYGPDAVATWGFTRQPRRIAIDPPRESGDCRW